MTQKVAIQANRLENLLKTSDTSLMMAASFCNAGCPVCFYEPQKIIRKPGECFVKGRRVEVTYQNHSSDFRILEDDVFLDLNAIDICMIRQDPPFDMEYMTSLYALNSLNSKAKIFNGPSGILNNPEKLIPFKFPEFMPPTMVINTINDEALSFVEEQKQVILKPLYWFGGRHVALLESSDMDSATHQIQNGLENHKTIVLQKFLPQIYDGDTRVKIINGKPVIAMRRVPKSGEFLANLAIGGSAHKTELTERELEICNQLGDYLIKQGINFAGVDLIGEQLIEVNITSPTGLVAIDKLYGVNFCDPLVASMISNETAYHAKLI